MSSLPVRPPRDQWPAFLQVAPPLFDYEITAVGHVIRCRRCWFNWFLAYNSAPEARQKFVGVLIEHDADHASRGNRAP